MTFESHSGLEPDSERIISISIPNPPLAGVVGEQLRAMYDGLLTEPLPEKLVSLLRSFDEPRDP
jgi:Anti-sigma factor NepR